MASTKSKKKAKAKAKPSKKKTKAKPKRRKTSRSRKRGTLKKQIVTVVLMLGSIGGLFSFPFTVVDMKRNMPSIHFESTGTAYGSHISNGVKVVEKNFNGKLKNRSHAPNSIIRIMLVVYNEKRDALLRNGYSGEKIFDFAEPGEGKEISLPIHLNPKESKDLNIVAFITVSGTDKELLETGETDAFGFFNAKYQFELFFEDVNGNFFDMQGNVVNQKLYSLKWIYQDEKWYALEPFLRKTASRVSFQFRKWMAFLGLSYQ